LFNKRFEIPKDWEYAKFSDVVQVNPRTKIDAKKSFYVPMAAVNIQNGSVDNFEERNTDENSSLPKFQKNDVLFARITPSTENGKICIIEDFPEENPQINHDGFMGDYNDRFMDQSVLDFHKDAGWVEKGLYQNIIDAKKSSGKIKMNEKIIDSVMFAAIALTF
jgi:hypothetical protein